jgi:putative hemolysin
MLEGLTTTDNSPAVLTGGFRLSCQTAPRVEIHEGRYTVRFARTRQEVDAALRLRFEVFNLELREGLESSYLRGRDSDDFDEACHHLIVIDTHERAVVGTYRMQTGEMAARARGFYSAGEFDLSRFPQSVLCNSVEIGRACVARSHRNTIVLFLLWKGLAIYLSHNRKRFLFGCCSLTSQDASDGMSVMELLRREGRMHTTLYAPALPGFECREGDPRGGQLREASIPKLFKTYLRFGARVCSPPAIDRDFKTIDFLVLFDRAEMSEQLRKTFFGA